ncbi:MAG: hypothetical protein AAF629_10930 [Chloroflexota bacterium]
MIPFKTIFFFFGLSFTFFACTPVRPASEIEERLAKSQASVSQVTDHNRFVYNKRGVHLLLDDALYTWPLDVWPIHMRYARTAVGEWGYVVQLVRLDNLDIEQWQYFMDLCAELHLQPILRLATTHDNDQGFWTAPVQDIDGSYHTVANQYANFVTSLRWPTETPYVIVGNEPNHGNEWGGQPDPAAYARFLIDVSTAVHHQVPQTKILNAGFDPYSPHTNGQPFIDGQAYIDSETFIDLMITAHPEVFQHVDIWASHSYPLGPLTAPPWQQTYQIDLINGATNPNQLPQIEGVYNRGINGYVWELRKLESYGITGIPVMITETGWRHAESTHLQSRDQQGHYPDLDTVAQYLDLAWQGNQGRYPKLPETGWTAWQDDPQVMAVIPFAFNGLPSVWGHTNWLALDEAGHVLSIYPMVTTLSKQENSIKP